MIENKFIGAAYSVVPETVKFDVKIVEFNEKKSDSDYNALKRSIKRDGQTDPIFIKDGLCGNGRHRVKICKELSINVIAIDVNPNLSDKAYLEMCNKDTFTSRNDSPTQLAIKAYIMTKEYGYEDAEAMATLGITNKNSIGYVRFIDNSRFSNILEDLAKGERVEVDGIFTRSIDVAKRKIAKIIEEEQIDYAPIDRTNEVGIDYNDFMESDRMKDWFWEQWRIFSSVYSMNMKHDTAMQYIELAKYKLQKVDAETGEVEAQHE